MSDFVFQGKKVHYRLVGEGRPLLMLNGIMMSTKSWAPFEAALTRGGNRLILVDLLDQEVSIIEDMVHPEAYYNTTIPVIYSPDFYDRRSLWMKKRKDLLTSTAFANASFLARMERLTRSAESHDVRDGLGFINCPVLLISSDQDHITPPEEQLYLRDHIPGAELVLLPKTGHAAFYERPDLFISIVSGFINHTEPIMLP